MSEGVQGSLGPASKGRNMLLWVLQILAAGMFLFAGSLKLAGAAPMVALFNTIGLGQWFRYATGGIEVVAAILLLIPGLAALGAALLVCTMLGAVLTHVSVVHTSPAMPMVLLTVCAVIFGGRRGQSADRVGR